MFPEWICLQPEMQSDRICYFYCSFGGPIFDPGAVRGQETAHLSLPGPAQWEENCELAWQHGRLLGFGGELAGPGEMLTCSSCCYNCYNFPEQSDNPGRWHRRKRSAFQHLPRPAGRHKEVGTERRGQMCVGPIL